MSETTHPIVARQRELDALQRLLGEVCGGSSRFVVVSGEPGIGKSLLIGELARRGEAVGCLVLRGTATELECDFPFGLLVDAVDPYLRSMDARAFERLAAEELAELASVFPAMRSLRPAASATGTVAERFRALYSVRELLERLAGPQPVVVTFDDVQWSDDASVEFLGHLLRRPPEASVLIAAAVRSGQEPPRIASAIEGAVRAGRLEVLELAPLDLGAAARLVGDRPSSELELLYRETGGNPFYLLQLARNSVGSGVVSSEPAWADTGEVPAAVRAAITAELDALPAPVRAFAQAAAVSGDPFEVDLAIPIAAMSPADALAALDVLIGREILHRTEAPRRFRFRHPLVRKAIYATCPVGTRLVCHERASAALAALGAPAIIRAHHVAQSARQGDTAAAELLQEAGFEVASRAPSSAAVWFEAALRALPSSTPPDERLRLLSALADAYGATGRLEDSRKALLSAVELVGEDVWTRVRLISARSKIELLLGFREQAQAGVLEAMHEVSDDAPQIGARLMVELASSAFHGADFEGIRSWSTRALKIARSYEDRGLAMAALSSLALAEASAGPVSDAQVHCHQAVALIDAMPDDELADELDALADLCGAEYQLQRFAEAEAHARRGLALARAMGRGEVFPWLSLVLSGVLFSTGRLAQAADLIDGMIEAARLTDNAVGLASALVNGGITWLAAGDVNAALKAAQEAVALTRQMTPNVVAAWAGSLVGAALLEAGQPERAAETIVRTGGGPELPLIPGGFNVNFLEILTRAWLASGRQADARRSAESAQQRARQFPLGLSTAAAELAIAAVALDAGDPRHAAEHALAAVEHADSVGARLVVGLSRSLAGRALAALGQRDPAAAQLEQAVAMLEQCGARRDVAAAERELRRLGRSVHHRTASGAREGAGVASLTGRELEVAHLVVDRRTNPEIAAELFLSIKTVETHLRNIFRKLDASSRVEVARIIERDQAAAGRAP